MRASQYAVGLLFAAFALKGFAQVSDQYRAAAQAYRNAAARCQNPAGAACMRQNAQYYDCLADELQGGAACSSAPTCSTSCTNSVQPGPTPSVITQGGSTNQKAQNVGNLVGLGLSLLTKHPSTESQQNAPLATIPDPTEIASKSATVQQEKLREEASDLLHQSDNLLVPTTTGGLEASANLPAGSAVIGVLDDDQNPNRNPSSYSPQLNETQLQDAADTSSTISGLLNVPAGNGSDITSDFSSDQVATLPSLSVIDSKEQSEAQSLGPDWGNSLSQLKDEALKIKGEVASSLTGSAADKVADLLGEVDPLKDGASAAIRTLLPETDPSDVTIGSMLQNKFVDLASDKLADSLLSAKDQLACSSNDSEVERSACMVLMAPMNQGRGLYTYGKILVDRAETMMTAVQAEFFSNQPH